MNIFVRRAAIIAVRFSIGAMFLLTGCASTSYTATAKSGQKTFLGLAIAMNEGCQSGGASYPETPVYPQHGQLSFELNESRFKNGIDGQFRACAGRKVNGAGVYYRSDSGFAGSDRLVVRTSDRANHEIKIKVVK